MQEGTYPENLRAVIGFFVFSLAVGTVEVLPVKFGCPVTEVVDLDTQEALVAETEAESVAGVGDDRESVGVVVELEVDRVDMSLLQLSEDPLLAVVEVYGAGARSSLLQAHIHSWRKDLSLVQVD
jgi:hypothetical protein